MNSEKKKKGMKSSGIRSVGCWEKGGGGEERKTLSRVNMFPSNQGGSLTKEEGGCKLVAKPHENVKGGGEEGGKEGRVFG